MRYGSVCSGIEAATVAWHPLGWVPAFFSDIAPFPRALLAHHYPHVPLHGDFTTIGGDEYGAIDLLVGGTPCQDFSVSGLRAGLAGARGNLTVSFLALAKRKKPRWVVWENVPGVLSNNGGRAFGAILGGLAECGYGFAYRVLDAQYFGVPQRRRRVFVIGYLGDWRPAAAVLFELDALRGDITPSREAGENVAGTLGTRTCRSIGAEEAAAGNLIVEPTPINTQIALRHNALGERTGLGIGDSGDVAFTLQAQHSHAVAYPIHQQAYQAERGGKNRKGKDDGRGNGLGIGRVGDPAPTVTCGDRHAIAFTQNQRDEVRVMQVAGALSANSGCKQQSYVAAVNLRGREGGAMPECADIASVRASSGGSSRSFLAQDMVIRRFTPRECERLQGFEDDYTLIPYRGKIATDTPRYEALGNSMHTGTMKWLGDRIAMVEKMI